MNGLNWKKRLNEIALIAIMLITPLPAIASDKQSSGDIDWNAVIATVIGFGGLAFGVYSQWESKYSTKAQENIALLIDTKINQAISQAQNSSGIQYDNELENTKGELRKNLADTESKLTTLLTQQIENTKELKSSIAILTEKISGSGVAILTLQNTIDKTETRLAAEIDGVKRDLNGGLSSIRQQYGHELESNKEKISSLKDEIKGLTAIVQDLLTRVHTLEDRTTTPGISRS